MPRSLSSMLSTKPKALRRLAARLYGQPLAITPAKLEEVCEFFEQYRGGLRLSREQLLAYRDDYEPEGEEAGPGYEMAGSVAVLRLHGVIAQKMNLMMYFSGGTSTEMFGQAFDRAMADERVKGIVIDADSPGGEISGVDELSRQIFEARGTKPIITVSNRQMASAGYYIGSAADEVVTTATSMTGSIGVVSKHYDRSKADAERGEKFTMIFAGRHKVDGHPHEPLSAQSKRTMQEMVDDAYGMFVAAVARNRGVSVEKVESSFGQGKCFLGQRAVEAGLCDRVGTLEGVLAQLNEHANKPSPSTARPPAQRLATSQSPVPPAQTKEVSTVDPKIKAALFARGLIGSIDASDEVCQAALGAFCAARGVKAPEGVEATVQLLGSANTAVIAGVAEPLRPLKAGKRRRGRVRAEGDDEEDLDAEDDEEGVDAEDDEEDEPTARSRRKKIAANERTRILEIQSRGRLLGASEELIEASISSGEDVGQALVRFTDAASQNETPVTPVGSIKPNGSGVDVFSQGAVEAIYARVCGGVDANNQPLKLSPVAAGLRYKRSIDIATEAVRMSGQRTDAMDPDDIASAFLALGGTGRQTTRLLAADGGYNRPGDYPNILSGVAHKMKERMLEINTTTYREWCFQRESVPDFHPRTIVALGSSGEYDHVPDAEPFNEEKNTEEVGWISTDRYGRAGSLTPVMITNDELGFFFEKMQSDMAGLDLTLNRLCVNLLIANPVLPNGNALFSSGNANIIDAGNGGAPSVTQSDLVRQKMRAQLDIGGKNRIRISPSIALIGAKWETPAEQVWTRPTEGVVPVTDATYNNFRGKIRPIVEQMLDDHTAAAGQVWYAFADPRIAAVIIYMHQTGFEGGKMESWYDFNTKCRKYTIEGRMGAAVRQYRAGVRNSGGNVSF